VRFVLLAVLLAAFSASAKERVLEFHSDIAIGAGGELAVRERIAVQVEGREIQRGILRDFPTRYANYLGLRVSVPFFVQGVTRNGRPEPYRVEALANGERIRIGNPQVLLPRGRHVYEITYRTSRQVGFFGEHDELYWNVNGNGWAFAFDHISAEVTLPGRVAAADLKLEGYTGAQGARGRDYASEAHDGAAAFRATRDLAPREGLTIVVGFPKGVVSPPSWGERARWLAADNQPLLAGLGGLALLTALLWGVWTVVGRDPRSGPKFPRYEPPPGLGAAGVRYVDRMGFDERCLAAALLGLGSRGFLRIRQAGARYGIERTGKSVDWLPGEQTLARNLVPERGQVWLEQQHDTAVQAARDSFCSELEGYFGDKLFATNRWPLFFGAVILILTIVAIIALEGEGFVADIHVLPLVAVVIAMIVLLWLFARWLPAYSAYGRKVQDAIEGLRQYLSIAEADDLARMKAPPQTREEFAKFLPYAVALDVEETWAHRFAAILGVAAVAAAVAHYYESSAGSDSSGRDFGTSVSGLGETVAAASTPPGSSSGSSDSGGGGGGSSGGGGGGGGGSGW
jgi:uncharacterized membrane protein YgcG